MQTPGKTAVLTAAAVSCEQTLTLELESTPGLNCPRRPSFLWHVPSLRYTCGLGWRMH